MKTKQITILKKPVLLVDGLPAGAKFRITEEGVLIYEVDGVKEVLHNVPPIKEFISTLKDLTEEQAAELVEQTDNPFWYGQGLPFIDYSNDVNSFENAKASCLSALEKEGVLFNNPYHPQSIKPTSRAHYDDLVAKWQSAEANVFSENTLIFNLQR